MSGFPSAVGLPHGQPAFEQGPGPWGNPESFWIEGGRWSLQCPVWVLAVWKLQLGWWQRPDRWPLWPTFL